MLGFEVSGVQSQDCAAAAGGFDVQAHDAGVEFGVVACGRGDLADGDNLFAGERVVRAGSRRGFAIGPAGLRAGQMRLSCSAW